MWRHLIMLINLDTMPCDLYEEGLVIAIILWETAIADCSLSLPFPRNTRAYLDTASWTSFPGHNVCSWSTYLANLLGFMDVLNLLLYQLFVHRQGDNIGPSDVKLHFCKMSLWKRNPKSPAKYMHLSPPQTWGKHWICVTIVVEMVISAFHFHYEKKYQIWQLCDFWGLYLTGMFPFIWRIRFVSRGISVATQCFIYNVFYVVTHFNFIRKLQIHVADVIIFQSIVQTCFDYWSLGVETAEEDDHLAQHGVSSSVSTINFLWIPVTRAYHFNPALGLRTPPLTMQSTSFRGDWWCVYVQATNQQLDFIWFVSEGLQL